MTGSLAVIVYERLSGIVVLLLFALVASLVENRFVREMPLLYVSLLVSLLGILLLLLAWKKVPRGFLAGRPCRRPWLRQAPRQAGRLPRHHPRLRQPPRPVAPGLFLGHAAAVQRGAALLFLIGRALHLDRIPLLDYFFSIPIMLFILSFPISINGLGVRDLFLIKLFSPVPLPGPVRHRLLPARPGVQPAAGRRRRRDLHFPRKMIRSKTRPAGRRPAPAVRHQPGEAARDPGEDPGGPARLQASKQDKSSS